MTDLISREAAIAVLMGIPDDDEGDSYAGGYNEAKQDCIKALTNMPSADTLATNEINALKDALAQAEGEIADLQQSLNLWMDAARDEAY